LPKFSIGWKLVSMCFYFGGKLLVGGNAALT